ncbi:23S rRNA pseudouridine1911/1915/1917 synthase [Alloprevotella rava]|uniref:Pseudouridine synthase n=2 Tax=Alloprevotella rava TaxID=671218 RepID=A0A7W5YGG6_9BACT|nr:23S rRNA pseudouridine1911/1915/1917 synthase [Alloprevotella rava]
MKMQNKSQQLFTSFVVKTATTLLPFIQHCLNGISRSKAKSIMTGGGVRVDRAIVKQFDYELQPGMRVEISRRKPKNELSNKFVRIVYEDSQIIVIEKAIGILSMASMNHPYCVKTILDEYFRRTHQKCTAHVVHRLDRDTSGLLVYAKTQRAEQILENNWQSIVTDRRYVALVSGRMEEKAGVVRSWLKDNKAYFTYSSETDNGGKYAVTHFKTIKAADRYSLVDLKLETGRKNQIRVHMKDLNHPVCGDIKYGNGDDPIGRLALHAFRLNFFHPITSEPLRFETPYPKNFLSVFHPSADR